ncbi:MAG: ferrochelatase [Nitrospiria bacterium]
MRNRLSQRIAVLLMAHGGPGSLDDVEPFLSHIMKERKPSPEVVDQVRERYRLIGGKSSLLEVTQQQAQALEKMLNQAGSRFDVFVGMRHWTPFIHETVKEILDNRAESLVAVSLAPQYSRMSVGAYIAALKETLTEAGSDLPTTAVESWHDQPLLLDAFAEKVKKALADYPDAVRPKVQLLFTAHSLPERILAEGDPYPREVAATVAGVVERLRHHLSGMRWRFAYQSRGLRPGKWLGPEVEEVIDEMEEMVAKGDRHLLVVPVGFVSDHVEILYDIDILYKEAAASKGIELRRTESLNASPLFIKALAGVVHSNLPVSF